MPNGFSMRHCILLEKQSNSAAAVRNTFRLGIRHPRGSAGGSGIGCHLRELEVKCIKILKMKVGGFTEELLEL